MLRLERLKILKYRRIAPGTELHFSPRHNVLLGKNATGKTTLLELIAHAVSLDFSELHDEPFEVDFDLDIDGSRVHVAIRNELADDALPSPSPGLRHSFRSIGRIVIPPLEVVVEPDATKLLVAGREPELISPISLTRPFAWLLVAAVHRHLPTGRYPFVASTSRFDEGLHEFYAITTDTVAVTRSRSHPMDAEIMLLQPLRWAYDAILAVVTPQEDLPRSIRIDKKDAPFFRVLASLMAVEDVSVDLDNLQTTVDDARSMTVFGNAKFRCLRSDGSSDTNGRLSYGERRFLSLWCYLEGSAHIAIIDELVNGLHHSWIEATMDKLGDRQSFLTSQNPLLMDYLGFESAEDVQRTFILCPGASEASGGRLPIRNLSAEEAERFQRAYAVGIQHVSEILRDQGLW